MLLHRIGFAQQRRMRGTAPGSMYRISSSSSSGSACSSSACPWQLLPLAALALAAYAPGSPCHWQRQLQQRQLQQCLLPTSSLAYMVMSVRQWRPYCSEVVKLVLRDLLGLIPFHTREKGRECLCVSGPSPRHYRRPPSLDRESSVDSVGFCLGITEGLCE